MRSVREITEVANQRAGAEAERAAIVAWLRSNPRLLIDLPSPDDGPFTQQDKTIAFVRQNDADAIQSGEHFRDV